LDDPIQYQAYGDFLLFSIENHGMIDAFIKSEKQEGRTRAEDTPIRFFEFVTEHYWHQSIGNGVEAFRKTLPLAD